MLIRNQFDSPSGRDSIAARMQRFTAVLAKLEDIYGSRPFPHQTVQSLVELSLLVDAVRPRTILEIGCGSRSSTVALASAAAELPHTCTLRGVDIEPIDWATFSSQHFGDMRFGPVEDIAIDATTFEIDPAWPTPILTLYDAHDHDLEGKVISEHAIRSWFPALSGMTVAVHDCSVFPGDQTLDLPETHREASHFSGRKIAGYFEVIPLTRWMNDHRVDFVRPGDVLQALGFEGHDSSLIYFVAP